MASRRPQGEVGSPNGRWKTLQNWVEPFGITAHTGMELTRKDLDDDLLVFEPTHNSDSGANEGHSTRLLPQQKLLNFVDDAWLEPIVMAGLRDERCAADGGIPWNSGSA